MYKFVNKGIKRGGRTCGFVNNWQLLPQGGYNLKQTGIWGQWVNWTSAFAFPTHTTCNRYLYTLGEKTQPGLCLVDVCKLANFTLV